MKLMNILFLIVSLALLLLGCSAQPRGQQLQEQEHADSHVSDFPLEEISQDEIDALDMAINDEYKAKALYRKVLDKFGDVKPFSNIIGAEENHIQELEDIYDKYDLPIPTDGWYEKVPEFESVTEACEAGVQAEIENAELYDELFSKVDNQDIIAVFTSLRDASLEKHLPAFQRCGGGNV